ncbi:SH3 domain-containing protein [Microbispora hainanensis]|uniref:SH3 domain-containing protein n=1 Tax=Microbispora hainanensis TaxID=568844 RepID=A0A544YUX0_9ACTN|nr:hypothetical protein [Microbispora hainanensis]TQS20585.1 hypothetical protein FLX08_15640 [Microbispora hainanensis]
MTVAKSIVPALATLAAAGWLVAGQPTPALAGPAGSDAGGHLTPRIATEPASGVRGHPGSGAATVRPPGPGDPTASGPYGEVVHQAQRGPGLVCAYRIKGVRKGGFLNVREGAGIRHAPVAKLRPADGGFSGACTATGGWIAVKTAGGTSGYAAARYLRRLDLSGRPSLSCVYRLRHVRKGSFLNVREGAGIHHAPVGKLRRADGNIAGACDATRGWVAVDSGDGIPGWASARYLRRM